MTRSSYNSSKRVIIQLRIILVALALIHFFASSGLAEGNGNAATKSENQLRMSAPLFRDAKLQAEWESYNLNLVERLKQDKSRLSVGTGAACPPDNSPERLARLPWPKLTQTEAASCVFRYLQGTTNEDDLKRRMAALGFDKQPGNTCSITFTAYQNGQHSRRFAQPLEPCFYFLRRDGAIYGGLFAFLIYAQTLHVSFDRKVTSVTLSSLIN
jgi:hypothetical protein